MREDMTIQDFFRELDKVGASIAIDREACSVTKVQVVAQAPGIAGGEVTIQKLRTGHDAAATIAGALRDLREDLAARHELIQQRAAARAVAAAAAPLQPADLELDKASA